MLIDLLHSIRKVYSLLVQQEKQDLVPLDESKLLALSNNSFIGNSSHGRGNMTPTRGRGGRGVRASGAW